MRVIENKCFCFNLCNCLSLNTGHTVLHRESLWLMSVSEIHTVRWQTVSQRLSASYDSLLMTYHCTLSPVTLLLVCPHLHSTSPPFSATHLVHITLFPKGLLCYFNVTFEEYWMHLLMSEQHFPGNVGCSPLVLMMVWNFSCSVWNVVMVVLCCWLHVGKTLCMHVLPFKCKSHKVEERLRWQKAQQFLSSNVCSKESCNLHFCRDINNVLERASLLWTESSIPKPT